MQPTLKRNWGSSPDPEVLWSEPEPGLNSELTQVSMQMGTVYGAKWGSEGENVSTGAWRWEVGREVLVWSCTSQACSLSERFGHQEPRAVLAEATVKATILRL